MDTIPSWFWMIIVAGLSGMLGLILFYVAMFVRESTFTVREFRFMMVEFHDIIDSVKIVIEKSQRIVDMISGTVEMITETIVKPISAISSAIMGVKKFFTKFTGNEQKEEEMEEVIENEE